MGDKVAAATNAARSRRQPGPAAAGEEQRRPDELYENDARGDGGGRLEVVRCLISATAAVKCIALPIPLTRKGAASASRAIFHTSASPRLYGLGPQLSYVIMLAGRRRSERGWRVR
jgi:hypothetical protein